MYPAASGEPADMRLPPTLLLPALLALLLSAGCRRAEPPAPVSHCGQDFECLLQRAQECQPGSATVWQQFPVNGKQVRVLARYEVVGRVQGLCHVRRTQLEPPPPPPPVDAGQLEEEPYEPFQSLWKTLPPVPLFGPRRRELLPAQMQCLYPMDSVVGALWRAQHGLSTQAELDLCHEGDGSCERTPLPYLGHECVLDDCLLGRYTFACDLKEPGRKLTTHDCIGTRLSDENPGCVLLCKSRQPYLRCRGVDGPAPGDEPIYIHDPSLTARMPPEEQEATRALEAKLMRKREEYRRRVQQREAARKSAAGAEPAPEPRQD